MVRSDPSSNRLRRAGDRKGSVGPAVVTSLLALARSWGYITAGAAFIFNLVIVSVALRWALFIERTLGEAGAQAVG